MSKRKKNIAIVFLCSFVFVTSVLFLLAQQEIPVLMYHFVGSEREAAEDSLVVSEKTFKQQLAWLKQWGYQTLSLDEYAAARRNGKQRMGFRKSVLITFDDGNFSFHDQVFPLLEKYQIKAVNFLVLQSLLHRTEGSMSVDQAKRLSQSPLVTFGSHTANHKILKGLSEQEFEEEIVDSKRKLEETLGVPIQYFCYPGGHFDDRAWEIVQQAGYQLAFTTSFKRLQGRPLSEWSIPRVKITEKDHNLILYWGKVSGVYSAWHALRHRLIQFPLLSDS